MHLSIDEHQSGWFPAIRINFERSTDLLLAALVVGLCIFTLLYLITTGRSIIGSVARTAVFMLFSLIIHIITVIKESGQFLSKSIQQIPIAWYSVAALTVIPIAINIPRWAGVLYLLAYCMANAWVMMYGIQNKPGPKKEKVDEASKEDTKLTPPKTDSAKQPLARQSSTQIFTGMRITIQP